MLFQVLTKTEPLLALSLATTSCHICGVAFWDRFTIQSKKMYCLKIPQNLEVARFVFKIVRLQIWQWQCYRGTWQIAMQWHVMNCHSRSFPDFTRAYDMKSFLVLSHGTHQVDIDDLRGINTFNHWIILRKCKMILCFSIISQHWDDVEVEIFPFGWQGPVYPT